MSSLPVTPAGPVPEGSARKFALLIGIDRYDSYAAQDLEGCVEDVRLVEAYLKATVHIPEANISKLTSPATTSLQELSSGRPDLKSVEAAFTRLASDMKKGDFLYIHYSGHGVRLPTIFTVLKNGNEDEALILLGKTKGQVGYLRDVEMAYLLSKITDRGATVTVVLDCCHSGGAVSDLEESWVRPIGHSSRSASMMNHWMTSSKGIEFLAACRADQRAKEIPSKGRGGKSRGLFTDCLLKVLHENKHRQGLTCDMVYNLVRANVLEENEAQTVVFGGERRRAFSGVERVRLTTPCVTTVTNSVGSKYPYFVELDVGRAHGVIEGNEFGLYPSDKMFDDITDFNDHLAVCRIDKVEDFVSRGPVQHSVPVGSKAMQLHDILERYILQRKTAIVLPASPEVPDERVREVEKTLKAEGRLAETTKPGSAFFEISVRSSMESEISFTHNTRTGARATVNARSIEALLSHLAHLEVYYNLFNLGLSSQNSSLSVKAIGILPCGTRPPEPRKTPLCSPPPSTDGLEELVTRDHGPHDVQDGDIIQIRVTNESTKYVYIEVLDLEPWWKVSKMYPSEGENPILLEPNSNFDFYIEMSMSECVPGSTQPETFDAFVILATSSDRYSFPQKILPQFERDWSRDQLPFSQRAKGGRAGSLPVSTW